MALGELVGESSGRITGTRVLNPVAEQVKMEVSFQGGGNILGVPITDTATYWQVPRPGGVFYGEGDALWLTGDGESAHFAGFGVGRPTGSFPAGHFAVCGSAQSASRRLARLNSVAIVAEYDVDEAGNYRWTLWEWI